MLACAVCIGCKQNVNSKPILNKLNSHDFFALVLYILVIFFLKKIGKIMFCNLHNILSINHYSFVWFTESAKQKHVCKLVSPNDGSYNCWKFSLPPHPTICNSLILSLDISTFYEEKVCLEWNLYKISCLGLLPKFISEIINIFVLFLLLPNLNDGFKSIEI